MIDGVHIWRADLDSPSWPGPGELPAEERRRADRFLQEEAARRWVASRWALRRVLGRYLQEPAAKVELALGDHGKPRLRRRHGLEFSLSHSEGLALVAVAKRPVGVDVEAIRPRRGLRALAERALPAADVAAFAAAPAAEQPAIFYGAWVRLEARLKCLGTGLGEPVGSTAIAARNLELASEYAAAVAIAGGETGPVTVGEWLP